MKLKDVNEIMTKEQFAIGYHVWACYVGFLGFNTASDEEKVKKYKEYLKQHPDLVKGTLGDNK